MNFAEINFAWVTIAPLAIIGFFAGMIVMQQTINRIRVKNPIATILICLAFPVTGMAAGIIVGILISVCFGWSL